MKNISEETLDRLMEETESDGIIVITQKDYSSSLNAKNSGFFQAAYHLLKCVMVDAYGEHASEEQICAAMAIMAAGLAGKGDVIGSFSMAKK